MSPYRHKTTPLPTLTSGTTSWNLIKINEPSVRTADTMVKPSSLLTLWPGNKRNIKKSVGEQKEHWPYVLEVPEKVQFPHCEPGPLLVIPKGWSDLGLIARYILRNPSYLIWQKTRKILYYLRIMWGHPYAEVSQEGDQSKRQGGKDQNLPIKSKCRTKVVAG